MRNRFKEVSVVAVLGSLLLVLLVGIFSPNAATAGECIPPWRIRLGPTVSPFFAFPKSYYASVPPSDSSVGFYFQIEPESVATPASGPGTVSLIDPYFAKFETSVRANELIPVTISVRACADPPCDEECAPRQILQTRGPRIGSGPGTRFGSVFGCGLVPFDSGAEVECQEAGVFYVDCGLDIAPDTTGGAAPCDVGMAFRTTIYDEYCQEKVETLPVDCGERIELRSLAPVCDTARPPRPPFSVNSSGRKVLFAVGSSPLSLTALASCKDRVTVHQCEITPFQDPNPLNQRFPQLCVPKSPEFQPPRRDTTRPGRAHRHRQQ